MCAGNCISKKFILINRECELISGLLGAGLTDLRRVHRSTAFYYCAFYSLSIGLERLMKLILLLQNNGKINLKKYKHDLLTLSKDINISFEHESIEYAILKFLHKLATKGRYRIPDALHLGYIDNVNDEPIKEFYNNIGIKIKNKHQIKKKIHLPEHISEYIYFLHINENMTIEQNSMDAFNIVKEREHIAKYATMYFGRLLQPYLEIIDRLSASEEDIPYMYEHFTYLKGNDKYFREHKIFYRK